MCDDVERFEMEELIEKKPPEFKKKTDTGMEKLISKQSHSIEDKPVQMTVLPEPKTTFPIKKKPEERFELFWDKVSDMRIFYFGTALWCIGWNVVATWLAGKECLQFLQFIILGIMFIFSGIHCRFVHDRKNYKHAAYLLLICAIYILISVLILRELLNPLISNFPILPEISIKKSPEKIMNIGNIFLMIFTIYCNCTLIKLIGEQIGVEVDLLKIQVMELKNQKSAIFQEKIIRRQNTGLNLQQKNNSSINLETES